MRTLPIPDGMAEANGGFRHVIGESDPTRDDVRPCEYIITESTVYPGRPAFTALLELDDDERAAIAAGAKLTMTMDGAEVPWGIYVQPEA